MAGTMDWLDNTDLGGGGSSFGKILSGINFNDVGGAAKDLFGAMGDFAEAKDYKKAAYEATTSEAWEDASYRIQLAQTQRSMLQGIGRQQAEVAGAGLTEGGSAQDLLRSAAQQGNLEKQMVTFQGRVKEQQYQWQAEAYDEMAAKANQSGWMGIASGALKLGSSAGGLF